MITVTLYSRSGCHLCEQAQADLEQLRQKFPHRLEVMNIENDPDLLRQYALEIPVVAAGPFRLKAPFTTQELEITLAAEQDRQRHIQMVENSPRLEEVRQGGTWTTADRINEWMAQHYMATFNLVVFLYLFFAFLAPVLMKAGIETPANYLYKAYGFVCHQLGYRSFFLFGEQPYYPRQAAGVAGVATFQEATGVNEGSDPIDVFAARNYLGSEQVGYKVALCERDVAIYGGILIFGLLFAATHWRLRPIPWYVWVILGILPIALDGFSQLFSQPPLNFIPYRESTPALRVLTGFLFGFFTAWFGYPMVEESMSDMRQFTAAKRKRMGQPKQSPV
jgi:uncharacterized membrane protein